MVETDRIAEDGGREDRGYHDRKHEAGDESAAHGIQWIHESYPLDLVLQVGVGR
jgi:hypothetical protein